MDRYEELLDRALSSLPEKTQKFERFELPQIEMFYQGNKTIIRNFDAIVQKVRRPAQLLSKYFSKELAVPASIDGNKLVLNGKISDRNLKEKLQTFVDMAVICKECRRPDTRISDVGSVKMLICEACGARSPLKI
ncbi:MAG: translation initiation factor IF-2 subunit beta [Candidatus Micrarchaeota archaeon]|nr:translation initiation factor IF-2 subunit beta [Candidatus Micrarchaeota archaeon]